MVRVERYRRSGTHTARLRGKPMVTTLENLAIPSFSFVIAWCYGSVGNTLRRSMYDRSSHQTLVRFSHHLDQMIAIWWTLHYGARRLCTGTTVGALIPLLGKWTTDCFMDIPGDTNSKSRFLVHIQKSCHVLGKDLRRTSLVAVWSNYSRPQSTQYRYGYPAHSLF